MKIGLWVQLVFIVLEVSVLLTPAECFTIPISVSTGMAIIMALVKVKAVIVKVLLGLKAMGYETLVWRTSRKRRRRSPITTTWPVPVSMMSSEPVLIQDELLSAWEDLQHTAGKVIQFDLESCIKSAQSRSGGGVVEEHKPWDYLSQNLKFQQNARDYEYSLWISKILGSSIKNPWGCHILHEELRKSKPQNAVTSSKQS